MEYLLILENTNRPLGGRRTNKETAFAAKASWYVRRENDKKIRGRERENFHLLNQALREDGNTIRIIKGRTLLSHDSFKVKAVLKLVMSRQMMFPERVRERE